MEVSDQLHAPAALPQLPIGYETGRYGEDKSLVPDGELNTGRIVRSPSLYSMSYPDS
jgi:hypothetical protein